MIHQTTCVRCEQTTVCEHGDHAWQESMEKSVCEVDELPRFLPQPPARHGQGQSPTTSPHSACHSVSVSALAPKDRFPHHRVTIANMHTYCDCLLGQSCRLSLATTMTACWPRPMDEQPPSTCHPRDAIMQGSAPASHGTLSSRHGSHHRTPRICPTDLITPAGPSALGSLFSKNLRQAGAETLEQRS